jgi:hypothetical protein
MKSSVAEAGSLFALASAADVEVRGLNIRDLPEASLVSTVRMSPLAIALRTSAAYTLP